MKAYIKNQLTKLFVRQAKKILKNHNPLVVVVVGSVGKTSTKFAIASVLKQKYRVRYQEGNYNVPLTLSFVLTGQQLPNLMNPFGWMKAWLKGQKYIYANFPYEVVLLELGTDAPGDIIAFKDIITADIAVVSAVSEEHMEFFGDVEAVAEEELSVAQFAQKLIINGDDTNKEFIKLFVPDMTDVALYGYDKKATYNVSSQRNGHYSFNVAISFPDATKLETEVDVASKQGIKPIAAAVAVGDALGLTHHQIEKGIRSIQPAPGRMRVFDGINSTTIIDDTYNASPIAVEAALTALYDMKAPQKIAILGSMNELGAVSQTAHENIGELCNPNKLDLVITLGEQANTYIAAKAEEQGCKVIRTLSPIKAGKVAAQNASEGAVILVKGSQNRVFAEEAVKQLLANPSDIDNLVRQSDFWMAKKAEQFTDAP
jgi:UDP-N-acetylmuramyl pentapeptide synthase